MKTFLENKINWWVVIFSSLVFAVFIALVLPWVSAYTKEAVGGLGGPDTSFFYSGSELFDFAESYGQEGRRTYVILRWTFDLVWPLVYMLFLLSFTVQLVKGLKVRWLYHLYWLPIAATAFDYLENLLATLVMLLFPVWWLWLGTLTSIASTLKWGTLSLAFLVLTVLILMRVLKPLVSKNHK
ncbi:MULTISPECIES: hypothetical protein [unclassified Fusibacter]|uniref:hypothetical protein n=1 Tax=unclassified Fusibacter TaxID=2624464 RepID=UPI00101202BB|nr:MULTISPECIES: hypothetical protein [unclassified Fusibacter]MCK8061145.1 hypothetical protein [Fusibacter sp. A2]NPE23319.1 hypothetical protein [Fusibacter sp. A1]RXV59361.1 hypothetical protein DWB64_15980 [Fusibacter sp. A1]